MLMLCINRTTKGPNQAKLIFFYDWESDPNALNGIYELQAQLFPQYAIYVNRTTKGNNSAKIIQGDRVFTSSYGVYISYNDYIFQLISYARAFF